MNASYHEAVIVGAGMTGMAMALSLAKHAIPCLLIDKSTIEDTLSPDHDGRVSAIARGSQLILEELGVWQEMAKYAEPILDIIVQESGSPSKIHFDHTKVGDNPMGHIIENRHIRYALAKKVKETKAITLATEERVNGFEANPKSLMQLELANQGTIETNLLLAADGKFSLMRKAAKIDVRETDYQQTAIVATIKHKEPHQGLALERFFATGPFAVLPLGDNHSSLVWVEPHEVAQAILSLPEEEFMAYLNEKMQGYLGDLTLASRRWSYPLTAIIAKHLHAERFALVGDAGHGIHPIAGQGVNLGFRDVAVMGELLAKAKGKGQDIAHAALLNEYNRQRRIDIESMFLATDGINRLFSNANPVLQMARNTGFAMVNALPPLREGFMLKAMGIEKAA
jgi:2-octaprenyl-6-methoxyphenol hydroxylase